MIDRFLSNLNRYHLRSLKPVLIGVSGGRDSVVLCDLYYRSGEKFAIAHCNFSLRGAESDEDHIFVENLSKKYQVPFYSIKFDTQSEAEKSGKSIQMMARELRMNWFEKICKQENYDFYATAAHQDDAIETYFINQIRGTGIAGLHGILPKKGKLIHPLLFSSREEITHYAQENKLNWREDSSNLKTKYLRNKVRLELLPLLAEMNPQISQTINDNIFRIAAAEKIYLEKIQDYKDIMLTIHSGQIQVNLNPIHENENATTIIFEIIKDYGFSYSQAIQIMQNQSSSGNIYYSTHYELLKNRNQLIIKQLTKIKRDAPSLYLIEEGQTKMNQPISLSLAYLNDFSIVKDENIAQLDAQKLQFPLTLRKWKKGDEFQPLGMNGKKKLLSDYFIDSKMNLYEKEAQYILLSGDQVVWIVGKRIDERFKIRSSTNKILQITIKNKASQLH